MKGLFDTLPFRMIRGTWMGFEDGLRGRVDKNEKFIDGKRENDPSKKSTAGAFLSDRAGIMGGSETGKTIGKWVGGIGTGFFTAHLMAGIITAGALTGLWPIFAAAMMTIGAGIVGAAVCGFAGKYAGGVLGAVAGGIAGAFVGLYNGVFRRGPYAKAKEPEKQPFVPQAPEPPVAEPSPQQPCAGKTADIARAIQQADAAVQDGSISRNIAASPQEIAAAAAATPQGFAGRVQQGAGRENGAERGPAR